MSLFAAIAAAIVAVVRLETLVAAHYRRAVEALCAADGGVEAAVAELRQAADWTPVVAGLVQSPLSQGAFGGSKTVPGGGAVLVCCGPGSASDRLIADTLRSPMPQRRAVTWRPFLWAALDALAPRNPPSRLFVIVWVANDEDDRDGGDAADTNDTVIVRSEAVAADGVRRVAEALVSRQPAVGGPYLPAAENEAARLARVAVLSWREVR